MTTLTCALRDAPAIECNNQLAAIQALYHAIHQWGQPTLPLAKVPHVTTPLPNHTRRRWVLRPMRRPENFQPHSLLPMVVTQTPNASPSAPNIPSTKEHYDLLSQRTRSKVPHTVDPPIPRVDNATDLGPIARCTQSQTTAMANVITPAQADKWQYPAQFIQSLEIPVLRETSGKSLQYRQLRKHLKFSHMWNTSYFNELGQLCQGFSKV